MSIIRILITALFVFVQLSLLAQKEYKPLHTYIKNGGNLQATMNTVLTLEKDDDVKDDPELYYLAALCQRKANDVDNTKIYLKQPYDTVSFFNTTLGMYRYAMKCYSIDSLPNAKGKSKITYKSKCNALLKPRYANLYQAGIFFTRKRDFANAWNFWDMYLSSVKHPIFAKERFNDSDFNMSRAAFWYMACCFELKKFNEVFIYSDIAKADTANHDLYLQYRASAYAALKDTVNFEKELLTGIQEEPNDLFFFSNLMDLYNSTNQYDKSISVADSLAKIYPKRNIYRFAKATSLFGAKRSEECIKVSMDVINIDSTCAEGYYYIGYLQYLKADELDSKVKPNVASKDYAKSRQKVLEVYENALPYIEKYRKLKPEAITQWAPMLYRIYLLLNKEKEFSEVDQLMQKSAENKK